jgi:hypothetical protein
VARFVGKFGFNVPFLENGQIRRKIGFGVSGTWPDSSKKVVSLFLESGHIRRRYVFGVSGTWQDSSENWFWCFWNAARFVGTIYANSLVTFILT